MDWLPTSKSSRSSYPVQGAAEEQVARQVRRGAEGQRQVGSTGPEADQGDLQPVPGAAQPAGDAWTEGARRGLQAVGLPRTESLR